MEHVDPTGDGTWEAAPSPQLDKTVYNGSRPCSDCGYILGPVQALHSDICPSCSRRKATRQVQNRMA
jgi:hypothetical protein